MNRLADQATTLSSYDLLVTSVRHVMQGRSPVDAVAVVRSTLETLAEFLTPLDAARLAAHLPLEFRPCLLGGPDLTQTWSMDEFCRRLTQRQNMDSAADLARARSILQVLAETTSPLLDRSQLPAEFAPSWSTSDASESNGAA